MREQLSIFPNDERFVGGKRELPVKVANVASVPQRSLFRYPGGKTWFVPIFRKWMSQFDPAETNLVEPFLGGGIISLTAAFEDLCKSLVMVELDDEVAAVWDTVVNKGDGDGLADKIVKFELTVENAKRAIEADNPSIRDKAFATILKNRIYHGGILARGSGMLKRGENGKGIASRWYPTTLQRRIRDITTVVDKMQFIHGDAFETIEALGKVNSNVFFVDPPYSKAGKRLYTHFEIDHQKLLKQMSALEGSFLITYDDSEEILEMVKKNNLQFLRVPMKTTHHVTKYELIISDNFDWF